MTRIASLAVVAVCGLGAVATAGPAQAAQEQASPGAAGKMCVRTTTRNSANGYLVRVRNNCGRTVKVKIIMTYAADSRCFKLKKGQTRYRETTGIGVWKQTVFC
ncbi:hypothetical protein [Streptomyces tsukubensis]|uniref:Secreted protein n=1 Tax=Streptomyces tsukubensis TaxID=83656 RepID=A0A1V4AG09_9ACTN|nr:hypothetical protein [Streptomyces tsukubensis]OON82690.1 hypothetical protein B1H18_01140 [Streptomyces tsukubensis]QFR92138.1 hypothetical protein GBW32_02545 [Streptomyces tsukubensis]